MMYLYFKKQYSRKIKKLKLKNKLLKKDSTLDELVQIKKQEIQNFVIIMKYPKGVFIISQICYYKDIILMIDYYNLKLY